MREAPRATRSTDDHVSVRQAAGCHPGSRQASQERVMPDSPEAIQRERIREIELAEKLAEIQYDFTEATCNKERLLLASDMIRTQAELAECRRILAFQVSIPITSR